MASIVRPSSVVICGQPFEVVALAEGEPTPHPGTSSSPYTAAGQSSPRLQTIWIRDGQAHHYERDTMLHEIMHVALRLTSAEDGFMSGEEEERTVIALAVALLAVLRDNPELTGWLVA